MPLALVVVVVAAVVRSSVVPVLTGALPSCRMSVTIRTRKFINNPLLARRQMVSPRSY